MILSNINMNNTITSLAPPVPANKGPMLLLELLCFRFHGFVIFKFNDYEAVNQRQMVNPWKFDNTV